MENKDTAAGLVLLAKAAADATGANTDEGVRAFIRSDTVECGVRDEWRLEVCYVAGVSVKIIRGAS